MFLSDGWWRDLLAFTWDLRTFRGCRAIAEAFKSTMDAIRPCRFRLTPGKDAALVELAPGTRWVQAFFDFETAVGRGVGFLRLMPAGTESDVPGKAWTVLTTLDELKGFEEPSGPRRAHGVDHGELRGRRSWLERRQDEQSLVGGDPAVLVVGAGQGGLTVAAA